jgi:tape measure domain-containing protein
MSYTSSPGAIIRMGVDGADTSVRQIEQVAGGMNRLADTVQSVTRKLAATIGIGGGLAEIVQLSDQYTKYTSQLRLATQSQREFAVASADVKRIAKDSQAELMGTGVLYARIANGTRELGISQARVAAITEVVNLSLKVSAATTAESASAQLQLSQAFASGTLRGEEFNAVNEAAPRLMKALADGMGVPIGALKQMASDGQITSKMMSDVLPQALETLREEATKVQTIGGAFQVLKNSVMEFTAVKAEANGTVSVLTTGLGLLASNLGLVAGLLTTMTAVKAANWLAGWATGAYATAVANGQLRTSTLLAAEADVAATAAASALATARVAELRAAVLAAEGNTALAITMNGLIPAQARAAALAEAHTLALAAQTSALAATAGAAGIARGALAFLGGPVGAIVTVLGLAATAWSFMGSSAKEGAEKSAAAVRETTEEILAGLERQTEKLRERNKIAKLGIPSTKTETPASARLGEVTSAIDRAGKGTGEYAGLSQDVRIEILKALGREYGALTKQIEEFNKEFDEDTNNKNKKNAGEWMTKYANNTEKMTAELDKARKDLGAAFTPELEARIRKQFEVKETGSKKEASAYATLMTAVREKIAATDQEAAGLVPLNDAQKLQVALTEQLKSGKLKMTAANKAVYESQIKELGSNLELIAARKRNAELDQIQVGYAEQQGKALETALKEAEANLELARTFGMTKKAIADETIARMEARLEQMRSIDGAEDEVRALELLIDAKKRSAAAIGDLDEKEASKKAADEILKDQTKMWDSVDQIGREAFSSIWDSGKSTLDRLRDTAKSGLAAVLYEMGKRSVINLVLSASGTGASGLAAAASSPGGGALGAAGSAGNLLMGGASLFGAGGLTGSIAAGAGWMTGATTLSGSLAAAGSLAATGTLGGIASSLGMVAGALGPIALGIGAAVALYKHFDTGNTEHSGGAASASSSGVRAVDSSYIGFHLPERNAAADQMTAGLASGIVSILDSTALAFGKTAGYTAATAFADDSSKDGAWGALLIDKLGEKVVNWKDTQTSRWAPKEFADGAAGQAQYLAALSGSVRAALDAIGLPSWATKMLDDLGNGASIEDMAKVVDQINATQQALSTLGANIKGFAGLSDGATSALIAASGGVASLASNASAYFDSFYTDVEKAASGMGKIKDALASVGVQLPANIADYRAEVEARMALGEEGAPAVAMLLKAAGAFAQLQPAVADVASTVRSAADILSEKNDLDKQYNQLTMTSTQLRELERQSIDATNLARFDQITQLQTAAEAKEALNTLFDSLKANVASSKSYISSLNMGSLSTLTPMQKYLEAKREESEALAKAKASPADSAAQAAWQAASTTFLTASQTIYASSAAFVADRAGVIANGKTLADIAGAQMSDVQQQLSLAGQQVSSLATLNTTAVGIQQAIINLGTSGGANGVVFDTQRYSAPVNVGSDVLVAEIKRLNDQVKTLLDETKGRRADAKVQGLDVEDAIGKSAEAVVDSIGKFVQGDNWVARNPQQRQPRR